MAKILKWIGAFFYSLIHAYLINLVAIAILYIAFRIFSLPWYWIVAIFFFLWGTLEMFRDLLLTLIALPYTWIAKHYPRATILPMVILVINAIWFAVRIWISCELTGTIAVVACLFATYEILMLTYKSVMAMLAMSCDD